MISNQFRASTFALAAAATAVFGSVATSPLQAQQVLSTDAAPLVASVGGDPIPALDFTKYVTAAKPADDADATESSSQPSTVADERLNLTADPTGAMQPPPRRYGRPRYQDSSHNADGSNKYTFEGAVGLTLPLGNTYKYYNTSYSFSVGGGRNFNKHFGVLAQFDYDHFGIGKAILDDQAALYIGPPCTPQTAPDNGCGVAIDGNNHVWSFTLNPTYNFYQGDKYGAYAVVGVGFYHKVTNFTTPEEASDGIYEYEENVNFDHYTSNAVGFNGGFGITYKFSRFADERFFIEARYVFVDNSQRQGYTYANTYGTTTPVTLTGSSNNDAFPANSNRTTYVPVRVGVRF